MQCVLKLPPELRCTRPCVLFRNFVHPKDLVSSIILWVSGAFSQKPLGNQTSLLKQQTVANLGISLKLSFYDVSTNFLMQKYSAWTSWWWTWHLILEFLHGSKLQQFNKAIKHFFQNAWIHQNARKSEVGLFYKSSYNFVMAVKKKERLQLFLVRNAMGFWVTKQKFREKTEKSPKNGREVRVSIFFSHPVVLEL